MREDQERADARLQLGFLQALRVAIPASLSADQPVKSAYENLEKKLMAKANDEAGQKPKRWRESKKKSSA